MTAAPSALWTATGPDIPVDDGPPPVEARVVIAGAGLTGLALAAMLAARGIACTVIEARRIGAGTTGRSSAKLSLVQGDVFARMRTHTDDGIVAAYGDSQRAAQAWLRETLGRPSDAVEPARSVIYATSDDGVESLDAEAEALEVGGVTPSRLAGPSLAELGLPFAVRAALALDEQDQLHPRWVVAELARHVRAVGVRIVEGCRLTGAHGEDGDGVVVETSSGEISAEQLVVATGTPVLDRGASFAALEPSRSYLAAYAVDEATPEGVHLGIDEGGHSLRRAAGTDGETLLLVGGGGHVTGRASSTLALLAEIDEWTRANWPSARRVTWWGAQDYRHASGVPFAGPLAGGGGRIFAATGYDKWGMTNAVASALRIAGRLAGDSPPWSGPLDDHGLGWAGLADAAALNAQVGARMLVDWPRAELSRGDADLADGEGRIVADGLKPVAESRVDGVTCRVSGVCTHLGGILAWNDAELSWDCPLHGSRFTPDGRLLEGPATSELASTRAEGTEAP